jgi:hypothetical protein
MFKISLLAMFFSISAPVIAQSNLVIDSIRIPVRVVGQTITLQTGKDTVLEIPGRKIDTIVTFNLETYGERMNIIATYSGTISSHIRNIGLELKRSQFLQQPLLYLSHNGLDYAPYECYIFFFQQDQYIGLGFDDTRVTGPAYSLRYFKLTTLIDFEHMLKEKLPKDVAEIYISGAAFFSSDTGEKIFLADGFKVGLKE